LHENCKETPGLRIAQVSPLYESVPPKLYGGTERVVHFLTEALLDLGHEVTLFASGDSRTRAELVPGAPEALRLNHCADPIAPHVAMMEQVFARASDFDVLHFHTDYLAYSLARRQSIPYVTTMHGRLDSPELEPIFRTFPEAPLISISDAQRDPVPDANWLGTVYHGLPTDLYRLYPARGRYLAFVGRISREKRVDRAIAIARALGMPLKIAAKIGAADRDYFESEIKHLFDDPLVDYVGEIGEEQKNAFLGGAAALLFPIDWPEPFGLVMIEAMACGTPVVAFRCGSVPEVMRNGVSGYVVDTLDEAVAATARAVELPRAGVRAYFEGRFSAPRMAEDYVALYEELVAGSRRRQGYGRTAFGLAAIEAEDGGEAAEGAMDGLGGEAGVGME
jgi:glycosyltransferase involved in cell wall biosynthesis